MIDYAYILTKNYPQCQWSLSGDDYAGLIWHESNSVPKPSQKDLENAYKLYKKNYDYIEKRLLEFPSLEELTIALWEKIVENNDQSVRDIQMKRKKIKSKYPKAEKEKLPAGISR